MTMKELVSLQDKLETYGSAVDMLRSSRTGGYEFPFASEYSNWRDEQEAWRTSVVLFDQSFHMTDYYFEGPDVHRLLSDVGVNSFANFGPNKAKQFVACNYDGYVIGDAILFGHTKDRVSLVGRPSIPHWVAFHAEAGGYDVKVTHDERSVANDGGRMTYRFQVQGPTAEALIRKVHQGSLPEIPFFNLGDLKIAGKHVRALNHSMSRMGGFELHGPAEDRDAIETALLDAGDEFGLVLGGSRAYATVSPESGWIPSPMPAIYAGEKMKAYRRWLSADGFEANASLGGSFYSARIEDYYQTPWDLGYGGHVKFDHDFIGCEALRELADGPHRKKVWLRWDKQDVLRVYASMLEDGLPFKYMEMPNAYYSILPFDKVVSGDKLVGLSTYTIYTSNVRSWFSLAMVDEELAYDDAQVAVVWGEEDGGSNRPIVERHAQTPIKATVSTKRLERQRSDG